MVCCVSRLSGWKGMWWKEYIKNYWEKPISQLLTIKFAKSIMHFKSFKKLFIKLLTYKLHEAICLNTSGRLTFVSGSSFWPIRRDSFSSSPWFSVTLCLWSLFSVILSLWTLSSVILSLWSLFSVIVSLWLMTSSHGSASSMTTRGKTDLLTASGVYNRNVSKVCQCHMSIKVSHSITVSRVYNTNVWKVWTFVNVMCL